jgi:hypothetical protein
VYVTQELRCVVIAVEPGITPITHEVTGDAKQDPSLIAVIYGRIIRAIDPSLTQEEGSDEYAMSKPLSPTFPAYDNRAPNPMTVTHHRPTIEADRDCHILTSMPKGC